MSSYVATFSADSSIPAVNQDFLTLKAGDATTLTLLVEGFETDDSITSIKLYAKTDPTNADDAATTIALTATLTTPTRDPNARTATFSLSAANTADLLIGRFFRVEAIVTRSAVPYTRTLMYGMIAATFPGSTVSAPSDEAYLRALGDATVLASMGSVTVGGTGIQAYTAGDMLYASATAILSKLGIGAANRVMTSTGSAPQWVDSLALAGSLVAATGLTATAGGLTVTAGGISVAAGTTAVQALTATTIVSSGTAAVQAFTATTGTFSTSLVSTTPGMRVGRAVPSGSGWDSTSSFLLVYDSTDVNLSGFDIAGINSTPRVRGLAAGGTIASPSAIVANQDLLAMVGCAYDGSAWSGRQGKVLITAGSNWTGSNHETVVTVHTTPNGSTTVGEVWRFDGAGALRTATDPATGTTHKLRVAGTAMISLNAAAPQAGPTGTVMHLAQADGSTPVWLLDGYAGPPTMVMRRAQTTAAAPSAVTSGINVGILAVAGYGATAYSSNKQVVTVSSTEAWTDSATGFRTRISVCANGATSTTDALILGQDATATFANTVTVTTGGLTVSAGTTAVQALTATTGAFSGATVSITGQDVGSGASLVVGTGGTSTASRRITVACESVNGAMAQLRLGRGGAAGSANATIYFYATDDTLRVDVGGADRLTLSTTAATFATTIATSAPTGGAGAWKLGIANAVSPTSPNRTVTIDIGGTAYYLAAKTTND